MTESVVKIMPRPRSRWVTAVAVLLILTAAAVLWRSTIMPTKPKAAARGERSAGGISKGAVQSGADQARVVSPTKPKTVTHGAWPGGRLGDPTVWSGAEEGGAVSLEQAKQEGARALGSALPMPTYLPAGVEFSHAWLRPARMSKTKPIFVELRYTTGLWVEVQGHRQLSPWWLADRLNDPKGGTPMEDKPTPWLKVTVNGVEAMAHEPGTYGEGREGIAAGAVMWWKDGVEYRVTDVGGRPVSELLKVAESVK